MYCTCGSGFDRVYADREDSVAPDSEKVAVGLAAARKLDQQLEDSRFFERFFYGLAPLPRVVVALHLTERKVRSWLAPPAVADELSSPSAV